MSRYEQRVYGDPLLNEHIAEIIGQRYQMQPTAFVDTTDTDRRYAYICGAIVMPTMMQTGYLLVCGVRYEQPGAMDCLTEYASDDEAEMIDQAVLLQADYGHGVIDVWIGDTTRLMSLMGSAVVSYPIDYDQRDSFQLYIAQVRAALSERRKALYLHDAQRLRNAVLTYRKDQTAKAEAYPELYAAGSLLHTIVMTRPWERAHRLTQLIPTVTDDVETDTESKLDAEIYGGRAW